MNSSCFAKLSKAVPESILLLSLALLEISIPNYWIVDLKDWHFSSIVLAKLIAKETFITLVYLPNSLPYFNRGI